MMTTLTLSPAYPSLFPFHALASQFPSSMSPLLHVRRRLVSLAVAAASVRQDSPTWTQAPLSLVRAASADSSLFHISIDASDSPDLISAHTTAGQYLQLRLPSAVHAKPIFLAIASPPSLAATRGEFEFLVKRVEGSTAQLLCCLQSGDVVEMSGVMGRGFEIDRISSPDDAQTILIFATGSGISPIRSLIESAFSANERPDVRLYYGARNLQRMAYQDRFKNWESLGVKIVPVLSRPDDSWKGEKGYVQAVFSRAKQILDASSTAAVLCGQKAMTEEVASVLMADGVPQDKILKNF
ncbi:fruit protein pKIWI502 [Phalaenopsis equestris]|uniref:fruit protein pKIWI502 n=1 Tax=Phalaenopsis equestris TaxID=78828 RepID=UPI0009E1DDF6|nr:fruit protein pKIWI502 [Phalaenopsis equestris]